uniref:Putative bel12 ag transposon polyprotein n=1 Tax=Triatoma infestans TaxID=30076 RepID=A0A023F0J1_TRIIF
MQEEKIKEFIRARGYIKSSLTRMKTFSDKLTFDYTEINEIKARMEKLKELWNQFFDIQGKLSTSCSDESIDIDDESEIFENKYFAIMGKFETILKSNQVNTNSQLTNPLKVNNIIPVNLPSINLPTFQGGYKSWLSFKDTYVALIHNNNNLADSQKLHYLKSCLKGEAFETIQNLDVTENYYSIAWDLLNKRFGNNRLIAQIHVNRLLNLPRMRNHSLHDINNLLTEFVKSVKVLKALGYDIDKSHFLLVPMLSSKLDNYTIKLWESSLDANDAEIPHLEQLEDFLRKQIHILEATECNVNNSYNYKVKYIEGKGSAAYKETSKAQAFLGRGTAAPKSSKEHVYYNPKGTQLKNHTNNNKNYFKSFNKNNSSPVCLICKGSHTIYKCDIFKILSVAERITKIKDLNLCQNCLQSHESNECESGNCRVCNKKHNTYLHTDFKETGVHLMSEGSKFDVLLATAVVNVDNELNGRSVEARVLLDSGAQGNFITENLVQLLGLKKYKSNIQQIQGIGSSISEVKHVVSATIHSRINNYKRSLDFIILPKITEYLPSENLQFSPEMIPLSIRLADPNFYNPNKIDMLIGAELFLELFKSGKMQVCESMPAIYETELGWVACGRFEASKRQASLKLYCDSMPIIERPTDIQQELTRFWELEHFPDTKQYTEQERNLDEYYSETVSKNSDGRYIVKLPFKENPASLGNSAEGALSRFLSLERRLIKNPKVYSQYRAFMQEYVDLGHMCEVMERDNPSESICYLPHHPVFREDSKTTKIRVVFDASMKTTSGRSLNDILEKGPTIQQDAFCIILRFRTHRYVLTADIEKMYRQILVTPQDTNLQRIYWRNNPDDELKIYKLMTVTYGTSSAPYLAIRTLQQLAIENKDKYCLGSRIILSDFYVDDVLTGADSIEGLLEIQRQLSAILAQAGMNLRKWCSNYRHFTTHIQPKDDVNYTLKLLEDDTIKTLGMTWSPYYDIFEFKINLPPIIRLTKRYLLGTIARIYDPLGLIGPVITLAKIYIQQLWLLKLDWDDELPSEFQEQWMRFASNLEKLNKFKINRYVISDIPSKIELHCFCDASEKAYGACIYARSLDEDGSIRVRLLCSKSRVSPIKQVSLPRLELCGALLVSKLFSKLITILDINIEKVYFWTDSTIVLSWLAAEPIRWNTFVANRVAKIQSITQTHTWYHIHSKHNPADPISRGLDAEQFLKCDIWLHGPEWLSQRKEAWIFNDVISAEQEIPEKRSKKVKEFFISIDDSDSLISKYSSWRRLRPVVAFILRFINNSRQRDRTKRTKGHIAATELNYAEILCLKVAQREMFPLEIRNLTSNKPLGQNSRLVSLNPFLDNKHLVRVGGRLQNANLSYEQKHPVILDSKHHLTKIIAEHFHKLNLHIGAQGLLYKIRKRFWPLNGKTLCKKIVRNCLDCFKVNPRTQNYIMGPLPPERVTEGKPFTSTGVDYAGPILIKQSMKRNSSTVKAYICLFICLSTKAVHIEAVSDLSTLAFIAALNRFLARRGPVKKIYSDNGTTFIGASNKFLELRKLFKSVELKNELSYFLTENEISWQFIPPYSPNFGGLWEAGIKSTKYHLRRVLKSHAPTFEELNTLLCKIEAILNSRPLTPLSTNPDDLSILTPSHFLSLEPVTSLITEPETKLQGKYLQRWQRIQSAYFQFWKKWSSEYLSHLQQRYKWAKKYDSIQLGTLVLLKDANLPPLQWPLGRVVKIHKGQDGVVRVITVKTNKGLTQRAVTKVCPLPIE